MAGTARQRWGLSVSANPSDLRPALVAFFATSNPDQLAEQAADELMAELGAAVYRVLYGAEVIETDAEKPPAPELEAARARVLAAVSVLVPVPTAAEMKAQQDAAEAKATDRRRKHLEARKARKAAPHARAGVSPESP
jgi:hypothetical protein